MKGKSGWVLLAGCVTLLMAGVIYAWSVLKTPVKAEFGWTDTETQMCFTLTLCFFCLGGLLSGLISRRVTLRVRLLAAAVLVIGGFDLSAHAEGRLGLFYLGYGVLTALGVGVVYNAVIACVNGWFADKKGMASGAMMMSFGFSALLMSRAFQALLSGMGWKEIYMLLGTVIGLVIAASAFVLKNPPAARTAAETEKDVSTREMLKTGSFWKLFAFFTLLAAVGSTAIGFGRDYFRSVGMAENAAVTLAGLLAVFNGLGRLFSGWLCDRAGLSRTRMVTSAVAIGAPALALLACVTSSPLLGAVGLCLCGFSYGFSPTVSAALAGGFYGMKHFSLNFSVLNLVLIPASFMSTLAGRLYETTGAYQLALIVLTALSVVGLIVNMSIKKA
ncbi:MAG: MFS transporter [Eubacteriales bacterium]|nr:MFS transporter [Eubacteriales bacterium]